MKGADDRLKIVHLVHRPQRRGAELFALALADRHRTAGHDVRSLYLYGDFHEGLPPGAGDRLLGGREGHLVERLAGWHPGLLARLRRALRDLRPDIVQANGGATLKYASLAARGMDFTLVYRNIGDPAAWLRTPGKRWLYRRCIGPRIDAIAAISESSVPALRSLYGPAVPIEVLPTAVPVDAPASRTSRADQRTAVRTPASAFVVLYGGSLTAEKRVDRLLRATAAASAEGTTLHLWIVGDGPRRDALRRLADELRISDRTRFLGARDDLLDVMRAADLLALSSDTEGVPGVILEAASVAVPAVATRVGGVAEAVLDGETGLLVEPDDTQGFARAMAELANDPDRRRAMGEAARALVRRSYDLDRIAERYLRLYRGGVGTTADHAR